MRHKKLLNAGLARDNQASEQVEGWWEACKRRAEEFRRLGRHDATLIQFRWMIEEFRISVFAQELKTAFPVSVPRLERLWDQIPMR
jgi:ATP-dependent helicase HrpA